MFVTVILLIPLLTEFLIRQKALLFCVVLLINFATQLTNIALACFYANLIPPGFKFKKISAATMPIYIMTLGKIVGVLIGTSSINFIDQLDIHNYRPNPNFITLLVITGVSYGIIFFVYILKNPDFRIKALARVLRKKALEAFGV